MEQMFKVRQLFLFCKVTFLLPVKNPSPLQRFSVRVVQDPFRAGRQGGPQGLLVALPAQPDAQRRKSSALLPKLAGRRLRNCSPTRRQL